MRVYHRDQQEARSEDAVVSPLEPQPFVTEEGQEIERLRAELAAAIRQRDEARLEASFVDSRSPFIGGPLDGSMIDTDAPIYYADGESYHRCSWMVAVTDHEDDLNPLVLAKAFVYVHAGEEMARLTTAQLQRLRFVEYRRVAPLKGEG